MNIERQIMNLFESYKSKNFTVESNLLLGNSHAVDLILNSNSKKYADRIIEIKYFSKSLPPITLIRKATKQLLNAVSYYEGTLKKPVVPVLLIVYNNTTITTELINKYKKQATEYTNNIEGLERFKIEFIQENLINEFNIKKLLKR